MIPLTKYYNNETKTLTIPCDFNEELKDLPPNTQTVIFKEDRKKKNIQSLIKESIIYQIH
jgi:hypothetical protein